MLEPVGHRVLLKIEIEKESEGGIILVKNERMEKAGMEHGKVVSVGPEAWKVHNKAAGTVEPWASPGDTVVFSKYGGKLIIDPVSGEEYIILNDEDVLAKVTNNV